MLNEFMGIGANMEAALVVNPWNSGYVLFSSKSLLPLLSFVNSS